MATADFDRVSPGDLIEARLVNNIVDFLVSLDKRVAALEGSGAATNAPVISGWDPAGDVRVRTQITLHGYNFLVPTSLNTVNFDQVSISHFLSDSDSSHLVFPVPPVLSGLPRDVTFTVTNRNGTANTTIRILPESDVPTGVLTILDVTPDLGGPIQVAQTYTFQFRLEAIVDLPETFKLEPIFDEADGASVEAWQAAASLIGGVQVALRSREPITVGVSIKVPSGAKKVQFGLNVTAEHTDDAQLNKMSPVRTLMIGQSQPVSDIGADLAIAKIPPLDEFGNDAKTRRADIFGTNDGVEVEFGQEGPIPIVVTAHVAGTYRYETEIEAAAGNWEVVKVSPLNSVEGIDTEQRVIVTVKCKASGPGNERTFMVVRALHLKDDLSTDFTSFVRFPIRGFSR
jgi:hypothetical protein